MTARVLKRSLLHLVLLVGVAISLFPFYWLFVMASNTTGDIFKYPPTLTIGSKLLVNMRHMLDAIDFWGAFLNSLFVAAVTAPEFSTEAAPAPGVKARTPSKLDVTEEPACT